MTLLNRLKSIILLPFHVIAIIYFVITAIVIKAIDCDGEEK